MNLKPCPFCGGTELAIRNNGLCFVSCEGCAADGPTVHPSPFPEPIRDAAIRLWNTRADQHHTETPEQWAQRMATNE